MKLPNFMNPSADSLPKIWPDFYNNSKMEVIKKKFQKNVPLNQYSSWKKLKDSNDS